ncbi:MAG: polysaccharide biosynthesis protein [Roseivirga sp.]|nr:polysaccharide biosynthesis protein [Roseivirga sp.]
MLKNIRIPVLAMLVLLVLCHTNVYSQSGGLSNLQSVNVDDLSDSQILNYVNQAKERGLSQSQMEALARERGVSESQIAKLRARIMSLSGGTMVNGNGVDDNRTRSEDMASASDVFGILSGDALPSLTSEEKKIFGFELFRKSRLSFAPNLDLPTPVDYILGPGDELTLDLWGATQQFFRFPVSQEGTIRPQNLGPIQVNGLSIEQATRKIINRLSQVYGGLKGQGDKPPSIFYQVSLGAIKTINVEVFGAVSQSGMYALPSLATVYTALHAAGGPSTLGSFRNIRVVRNNKLLTTVDIYAFLTTGAKTGDLRLKSGDVIIVPPYDLRVDLTGQVKVPGLYEMKEGETVDDVLGFAYGFADRANRSLITIHRNGASEKEIIDVKSDEFENFTVANGDKIKVGRIFDRFANRITIQGAVAQIGDYQLKDGLTLKTAIENAGGLRGDAFGARGTIYRLREDLSQEILAVDINAVLNGSMADISLLKEDVIKVPSIYDLQEEYFVRIAGEVPNAGIFPFFRQMSVQDLIVLAGGFMSSSSGANIEISRRNQESGDMGLAEIITISINKDLSLSSDDRSLLLQPFDQVYVRMSPGYEVQGDLRIEGEVNAPGLYTISRKDERISDIIKRAQGTTGFAYLEGAILIRQSELSLTNKNKSPISTQDLDQLRSKILEGQNQLKNEDAEALIKRVNQLKSMTQNANHEDIGGVEIRRDIMRDFAKRDSLVDYSDFRKLEPVALEMGKIMMNPGSKDDIIVKPGDIISIPSKLETVRVAGEVTSPLNFRYDESLSFKDYIRISGGFLMTAKRGRSFVQYPNGERRGVKRFLFFKKYPKIEPGATIVITKKPERPPVNFQSIVAMASSLTTLAFIVERLSR